MVTTHIDSLITVCSYIVAMKFFKSFPSFLPVDNHCDAEEDNSDQRNQHQSEHGRSRLLRLEQNFISVELFKHASCSPFASYFLTCDFCPF